MYMDSEHFNIYRDEKTYFNLPLYYTHKNSWNSNKKEQHQNTHCNKLNKLLTT